MSRPLAAAAAIEAAFKRLEGTVSHNDARDFHATELKDVRQAAIEIEKWQRERKSLRNMRRIEPLLTGIQQYAGAVETLCQGTPYLPWIWAPIQLMLQIASQYTSVFDKLLAAYVQIAEALPRFDRYQKIFQQPDFQHVLALIYADILEFHRRAYKIFTRRAWKLLFDSLWTDFGPRFDAILRNLEKHCELVDREAVSFDMLEANKWRVTVQKDLRESAQWRATVQKELDLRERERTSARLQETLTWLSIEDRIQEDEFDLLCQKRVSGTCDWIFQNRKFRAWADDNTKTAFLWIWGIPGSGKTTLCAHLVKTLCGDENTTVLYYFCGTPANKQTDCSRLLRSLAIQLIRHEPALATHVCAEYVHRAVPASVAQVRKLLPDLLSAVPVPQILVDGLDECDPTSLAQILSELLTFSSGSTKLAKVLISSREGNSISKKLRQKPSLALRDESESTKKDIGIFIKRRLSETRSEWDFDVSPSSVARIEQELLRLSNGMFLWVQLVILAFQYQYTEDGLLSALKQLPETLQEAYDRIFDHILDIQDKSTKKKIHNIFEHLAYCERAIRDSELLSAIGTSFSSKYSPQASAIGSGIIDLCKPILEVSSNGVVDFVHFSAKEYVRNDSTKYFIHPCRGQESILQSCLAYILSTPGFLREDTSSSLRNEIIRKAHGIHQYAWEYWTSHLNQYARLKNAAGDPIHIDISDQLQSLFWLYKTRPINDTGAVVVLKPLKNVLQGIPEVLLLLSRVFTFQDLALSMEQENDDPREMQTKLARLDPTWLSEIHHRYEQHVEVLLTSTDPALIASLDPKQLQSFRGIYGGRSYFCRYKACSSALIGFDSQESRDQHEVAHVRRFKCEVSNCFMGDRRYKKQRELKLHHQKYHSLPHKPTLVLDSQNSASEDLSRYSISLHAQQKGFALQPGDSSGDFDKSPEYLNIDFSGEQ